MIEEIFIGEPPVGTPEEEEILRQEAEARGELDHILPELRPLAVRMIRLNLDPINAQEHKKEDLELTAASLTMYGQRSTITVNWNDPLIPGRITAGNGRFMSAKMIGWRWIAVVGTNDNEVDAIAWGLLDNRSGRKANMNYTQTGANLRTLQEAGHPMLTAMFSDEEALPLLREDFEAPEISDEVFDSTMLKGRSISKITASERLVVDQAIEHIRGEKGKALTEGSCLEAICKEYLERKGIINQSPAPAPEAPPETAEETLPLDFD